VCFAPLARTLFFAARLFAQRKNVSLGPSVPMMLIGTLGPRETFLRDGPKKKSSRSFQF